MTDTRLREAAELTWKALEADDGETETAPVGIKWLLNLNHAVAHLRAALTATADAPHTEEPMRDHTSGRCPDCGGCGQVEIGDEGLDVQSCGRCDGHGWLVNGVDAKAELNKLR